MQKKRKKERKNKNKEKQNTLGDTGTTLLTC